MYRLPASLRPVLAKPFGPVHDTGETLRKCKGRLVISVGDVVTQMFLDAGELPKLMLVDGVTKRSAKVDALANLPSHGVRTVRVENPAAEITHQLLSAMDAGLKGKGSTLIHVIGEEDLAALPAMIIAPEGAAVCYGQPPGRSPEPSGEGPAAHQRGGVVVVIVTPVVRQRAKDILEQMEVK